MCQHALTYFTAKVSVGLLGSTQCVTPTVLPSRAGISAQCSFYNGTYFVSFTLKTPGQVCLVVNSDFVNPLCLFGDPIETHTPQSSSSNVIYFGPGTTNAGIIYVSSGQTVYLAAGAHVLGRIQSTGSWGSCEKIYVRGRGMLNGFDYPIDSDGPSLVDLLPCANCIVEGIIMLNSPQYNVRIYGPNTTMQWTKCISWGYSTDGLSGGEGSIIQDSFIKVNDDSTKLFSTGMLFQRLVIWQMENGCPFMMSWNLNANTAFITARNCDIIFHERSAHYYDPDAAFCALHGGSGNLSNYLFEDIRLDNGAFTAVSLMLQPNPWATPAPPGIGSISNIYFRNIDSRMPYKALPSIKLNGYAPTPTSTIFKVVFDNCTVANQPMGASMMSSGARVTEVQFCKGCSNTAAPSDWRYFRKLLCFRFLI
jgi:hypothetical protein